MAEANDHFRMMHTMIRVVDLEKSIKFYTELLGMKLLRREEFPEGRFTLAFVGYGPETNNTVVELTHNWDQATPYELGSGFGHLALGVNDIYKVCADLEKQGAPVPRKPGPMKHGELIGLDTMR
jgi:lactoylglutathione lyase